MKLVTDAFSHSCRAYASVEGLADLAGYLNESERGLPLAFAMSEVPFIDLNTWWGFQENLRKYVENMGYNLSQDDKNGTSIQTDILSRSIGEFKNASDPVRQEFECIQRAAETDDVRYWELLMHIPHEVTYADFLIETEGYQALEGMITTLPNVILWPMIGLNNQVTELRKAYLLGITICSEDEKPLKSKLLSRRVV